MTQQKAQSRAEKSVLSSRRRDIRVMENGPLGLEVEPSGCRLWSLVVTLVSVGT